jgi:FkbM family methyltransferase
MASIMRERPIQREEIERQAAAGARAAPFSDDRVLCRVLGRFKMLVSAHDETIAPHLILDGCWEPWVTVAVYNRIRAGMRVVNVGANVGYFTLLMAARVGSKGKVDAFECNPEMFRLCKSNVCMNGMDGWTTVHERAASNREGHLDFEFDLRMPGSGRAMTSKRAGNHEGWRKITVASVALDDVVQGDVDFLLVDAEGHEPAVLAGASRLLANPKFEMLLEWSPMSYAEPKTFGQSILDMGFTPMIVGHMGELRPIDSDTFLAIERQEMIWFRRST